MAQGLAEAGASGIAILDQRRQLGEEAARELSETTSIPVRFYEGDVTDENRIGEVIGNVNQDLGSVDIVINSAGVVEYAVHFWCDGIIPAYDSHGQLKPQGGRL